MNRELFNILSSWPKGYIVDTDLALAIHKSNMSRYGLVNRALKDGSLIRLKRGVYLISIPHNGKTVDVFELAQVIYGPSFVSLESALQFHNLIPEMVYSVTSVTVKRSREFSTPLGIFSYKKIATPHFLLGVDRIESNSGSFFMANFWRAIADLIYLRRKDWIGLEKMCEDMRIEQEALAEMQVSSLLELVERYPNGRTRLILKRFYQELT